MLTAEQAGEYRLLILEEDPATAAFLGDNLTADGFVVDVRSNLNDGLGRVRSEHPQLIIADLNGHTLELVDTIRAAKDDAHIDHTVPLIVLGADADKRVRFIQRGVDDAIAKPFSYPELRARVERLLMRTYEPEQRRIITAPGLEVDLLARSVKVDGELVELSVKEWRLLVMLAADPTRVITKEALLLNLWGRADVRSTRTLDSHACRLRSKLAQPTGRRYVVNVWGVGYRLVDVAHIDALAA